MGGRKVLGVPENLTDSALYWAEKPGRVHQGGRRSVALEGPLEPRSEFTVRRRGVTVAQERRVLLFSHDPAPLAVASRNAPAAVERVWRVRVKSSITAIVGQQRDL